MPTEIPDAIKHLDFTEIRCQCQLYACKGKCTAPATVQVKFHALDHCDGKKDAEHELDADGNYTFVLCRPCLRSLAASTYGPIARLNMIGPYTCGTCGAPAKSVEPDLIREVTPL